MDIERLKNLITAYQKHFWQYSSKEYNETNVRNEFVNPFFEILGWDVLNKRNLPQHMREVRHEASVLVKEEGRNKKKKPDYAFYLGSEVCFFLETKKPAVNIMESKESAFQTRRYGWNGNLKVSVLTNFTDLIIYDTTIRPNENDDVTTAMVAHFHYTDYEEQIDEISRLLSYKSITSGTFQEIFANRNSSIKKEPFDQYFLNQISAWRLKLGQYIFEMSSNIDEESLNIFVQRLINRIVFLRICEDRNLDEYAQLKNIQNFGELKKIFRDADKKYNSGLFDLLDEERIKIADQVLIDIFKELYYPNSCYEFSIVDPYIIGQIYELFLEEKLAIQEKRLKIIKKPEIVDAQGVVNTPKNITDIVVKETLEPLYQTNSFHQWETYHVLDICCGSGNFLLSAYEYIVNQYITYFVENDMEQAISSGWIIPKGEDAYALSYIRKVLILKNNIFGVDIDSLAVEVAKFSLLIKLIEDSSLNEMQDYRKSHHCKILPNLDDNIKNGNSLVSADYLKYNDTLFCDSYLVQKIKLFDFKSEFGIEKFDAIVGNPPYIRVQNLVQYSKSEYEYFKSGMSGFDSAQSELLDKYYLFLERGLQLLSSKGKLGYIIPHKFMLIKTGKVLRSILSNKKCVSKIIHFGIEQVFVGRSTYTCLLFLDSVVRKDFKIGFVNDLARYYATGNINLRKYPIEYLSEASWSFLSEDILNVLEDIKDKCHPLAEYADIFVGLQTSADNIYIIKPESVSEGYVSFFDKNGVLQAVEERILKPCIYDVSLEKYDKIEANRMMIFPYHIVDGKPFLYSIEEMKSQFPKTWIYFEMFKDELEKRKRTDKKPERWYGFGRSQSLKRFSGKEHLICPVLSTEGNYVFDDASICFTGGGNGPFYGIEMKQDTKESIFYIQALLNHWLLERVVKSKASKFRGDYYSHGKQFIEKLPIYKIDFEDSNETKIHDHIVDSVRKLMQLKKERDELRTREQRKSFESLINMEERCLEEYITNLYGAKAVVKEISDEDERRI